MYIIVDGLARLLAPVLSVTMDELWRMLPGEREESVHMALFPRDLDQWKDAALLERWSALAAVRDQVNLQLEEKRKDKTIAANLSARVVIEADGDTAKLLSDYREFLPTLFGVSEVDLKTSADAQDLRPRAVVASSGPTAPSASAAGATCRKSAPNPIAPAFVRAASKRLLNR